MNQNALKTPLLEPYNQFTDRNDARINDRAPVRSYIRRFWAPFSLGTLTLALTNLFDILTPFALMKAIDAISQREPDALLRAICLYLLFMLGAVSFRHQWRIHFGRFHHSVADDLRNRLFRKYTELGPRFFEKNPTGELMSLMINDVNTFRMGVGPGLLILMDGVFLIVFIIPFMLSISVDWTWKTLILLPFIPFVIRFMEDRIGKASRVNQDRLAELSGYTQELVSGIRVVKGFAQESHRQKRHRDYSDLYATSCNLVAKYDAFFEPALQIGVATGSVILLAWGSADVLSGAVTLGTFVAFHEYIKRMIWPMAALGSGLSMLSQARSSYNRMAEVFSAKPEVKDDGQLTVDSFDSLTFRKLSFTYPDAQLPALSDVSFQIRKGDRVGIVGPVGSGKSTLIQIICRIREAPVGSVFVNEKDLRDYSVESWRSNMAVTLQEPFLFARTIQSNLLFGQPEGLLTTTHDRSIEVADAARIREEIERLPKAFQAWLGEKGVNLSGGQRQRMTMARSLSRFSSADTVSGSNSSAPASILVLDDSLSAVDTATEKALLGHLEEIRKRDRLLTLIVVSHRINAVQESDLILVLNNGRIEAQGRHDELIKHSITYRTLCMLQGLEVPQPMETESVTT
ncbi:MAG: ABC transporter ATP-binding protein [Deltaproteobacteria bacterium]|nr:ABC transporter ATP-binding protein [Deltaproteobacteria bacterium]